MTGASGLGRVLLPLSVVAALTGCSVAADRSGGPQTLQVVAGEDFWGSIAAQLGGSHVSVTSIVTDPNADPHDYESSSADARAFATADYVVLNGAGYDDWGQKLLDGNPSSSRTVLNVAELLGKRDGDNPHFWYGPGYVRSVADRITADYERLDPTDRSAFESAHAAFVNALMPYQQALATIGGQFAGRRVAATEDIFVYLATALHLDLISPREFMQAVAEGNDPPASAVAAFEQQITSRQAAVLVYNVQTVTAVTTNIQDLARQAGIPVVGISETIQPLGDTFQDWQVRQLTALRAALTSSHADG
ncbi:MAG: zinc ABC transporter substrate-binding protein [Candidatus Dormibacteraeota bacterium]|nr:zinc ABC transporter substrate-binding protein [Candidatus Dormibacteraeota bacterium]MBV9525016.1 zinc ABC transporter substrate-binding protein [Candidatus Dormibacteraeota bacterium]